MGAIKVALMVILFMVCCNFEGSQAILPSDVMKMLKKTNKRGPRIALLVPSSFELNPLLQSPSFKPGGPFKYIDCAGRRFHTGSIEGRKAIIAMTGKGMMNAATVSQMLLTLFDVRGLIHYGISGNADPNLNMGDITVPRQWAHTGLWNWQRYGDGPDDELSLEPEGDYTREIGSLNFGDYNNKTDDDNAVENFLNSVWYQPEDIFPIDGFPESKDSTFWVSVDHLFFELAKKLKDMKLEGCMNSTACLPQTPKVAIVKRGSSSNIYLDNVAYRSFLHSKFQVSPVDMESAAIALISHQQKVPFIAFRALSEPPGERSTQSNDVSTFSSLAVMNSVSVVLQFVRSMEKPDVSSM